MARWFENLGYDVWIAHLDTGPLYTPTIEENAQCLKDQIAHVRQQTGQKVVLVGHSMGGLVSRACLNLNDCRENVAALYTLGSPHSGVSWASPLVKTLNLISIGSLCNKQKAACQFTYRGSSFNDQIRNPSDIPFRFIGGDRNPFPHGWLMWPFDGPNDGTVGSHSAVGLTWPWKTNVVQGPEAGRYWTDETHSGSGSYFDRGEEERSNAFRCIKALMASDGPDPADCREATSLLLATAASEPVLSATTPDLIGDLVSGQSVSHTLQIDTGDHSLFYLSWVTGTLSFTLTQPGGQAIGPAYADAHPDVVTYTAGSGDGETPPFAAYAFTTTAPGLYTATITAGDVGTDTAGYLLFAALETTRTFTVAADANLYQAGDTATFTGTLQGDAGGITGATVSATLMRADGVTETLVFADLGSGVYTASYTVPDAPGYFQVTFTASGDDGGTPFTRQVDELLAIAPHAASLAGSYTDYPEDGDGDGFDDILALDVGVTATEAGTYTLSANLVVSGQTVAHAVQYTVLDGGTQTTTLRFDGWDIRRSQISGPYTVTNVYLVDLTAGGLPAEMADDTWVTANYDWRDFGFDSVYLPLVLRDQ